FEINLELLANLANLEKTYSPLPKYPFIQRDLSFIIGENIYQDDVSNLISQNGGEYLKHCELIDLYKNENIPAGHHSITYRLTYSNPKNTLTTEEVEKSEEEIIHTLEKEFKAQIRKI
ncbi:MAG TPA: phenylalanine--tRNA ligase subunit beta, partial [Elusimicrobia bacterium]|nr:phenylalanine--tRNA ligase subunit beta [Elusimicrobiota bacterium]